MLVRERQRLFEICCGIVGFPRSDYNVVGFAYEGNMEILLVIIIVVFLLGSIGLFFPNRFNIGVRLSRLKKAERSGARSTEAEVKNLRLVRINPGLISCLGARNMTDQTYLPTEAPDLPLGQCSEEKCLCKYTNLDDRRGDVHRRGAHEYLGGFLRNHETDRRQYSGRRTTDILT